MNYQDYLYKIKDLLITNDAKIVAHYYVDELVQQLAEDTGGFVSDSLEMARYGMQQNESTLIVAGVKFMGETAKILNPDKKIFMPDMDATCSLDLGCDYSEFKYFCDQHPDREVVVYANTSAKVKSIADWVVTSSIALPLVEHLTSMGKKIIWAPDKYLGNYILDQTGADMILWDGSCIVHEEYKTTELKKLKELKLQNQRAVKQKTVHQDHNKRPAMSASSVVSSSGVTSPLSMVRACVRRQIACVKRYLIGYLLTFIAPAY